MNQNIRPAHEAGIALLAVLFALLLLMLLALPFSVSMGTGAEAAARDVDLTAVEQESASVRDLLVASAALSHPTFDPTPEHDGLDEWPDHVELPAAFSELREGGRVLLGGEVWDLQRYLALDSASPLVFANLLGTTARLREDLAPDASTIVLEGGEGLPAAGFVWVANEVIHYGARNGTTLQDLTRGLFQEDGFVDGKGAIAAQCLVLDYRCVMAAAWPFVGRGGAMRGTRNGFDGLGELAEVARGGVGGFTPEELDTLRGAISGDTMTATASTWGRPERIFNDLEGDDPDVKKRSRSLRVRAPAQIGAGSTIRLRNLRTGTIEYGLVMTCGSEAAAVDFAQPLYRLDLLMKVVQDWPAIDTVVEALIPAPVNLNTASSQVLTAIFAELRRSSDLGVHDGADQRRAAVPPSLGRSEARALADEIVARRVPTGEAGAGTFTGWQDLVERVFKPRVEAASTPTTKQLWLTIYRELQTGRDAVLEMGTAPICFRSGPWVGYRAAASRSRSVVAPGVVGRHERTGLAAAVPGFGLEHVWNTQDAFEEAFRLDRRSPFWVTGPVNLGALPRGDAAPDPALRYYPQLVPTAYPDLGFGAPRYASTDPALASITPAPATVVPRGWNGLNDLLQFENFATSIDPRGHDVKKDGPFAMQNTGPAGGTAGAPAATAGRHGGISFPFATTDGFMNRFAISFWTEAQAIAGTVLFDHSDGDADRNRLAVLGRDDHLVVELIDEAGLDPEPTDSPAGIERTAMQWTLPLTELNLPANTPLHVNVSAYGGKPDELSVSVDGMTRGKPKYKTYLTSALKSFDPTLANNLTAPGTPGNDRWLDIAVESTEGFPDTGALRIGTEIFEYTSKNGTTFQCQWKDSTGGRAARRAGREERPSIPVDKNGNPTIDINSPEFQGVNLDVFPAHPAGTQVELYGYSAPLAENSPMMVGSTRLDGAIGGFAIARGWINNPRPIDLSTPSGTIPIGTGIDENWTGDLELADPVPSGRDYPPAPAQETIANGFSPTGGYALLIQRSFKFDSNVPGQLAVSSRVGGVELIRYATRQGTKLTGVQRAQSLPGDDKQISNDDYKAGEAQRFVTNFSDWPWDSPQTLWDDIPTLIVWVVPVSITVQSTDFVFDPAATKLTEWVQLYPEKGDADDTEWVRYDAVSDRRYLCRANRAAWNALRFELTRRNGRDTVQVGPLGPSATPGGDANPPWPKVTATADYIGYTPRLESDFPQIHAARFALRFRGDPMWDFAFAGETLQATSSHAHTDSMVMQCQRIAMEWGNFSALGGRLGRHDRVAIIAGSLANGKKRPDLEWHTVNWVARRFEADKLQQNQTPAEFMGPWPFQLVAFKKGVTGAYLGPTRGETLEPRRLDRIVKFPSGELPAAYCATPTLGASVGKGQPITGFVDEVEVRQQPLYDLVLDEVMPADGKQFVVVREMTFNSAGKLLPGGDLASQWPQTGGLVDIDGEIVAYKSQANGAFEIATNGRGLLNTQPRDHDRGARARFLSHRPVAILSSAAGERENVIPVQAVGSMPTTYGTALLGRELLHYTWVKIVGDKVTFEMPTWFPPGEDAKSPAARGLLRARFGSSAYSAASGEPLIAFPFRYWDRHVERSDDPELAYSQLTATEAPSFFRTLRWREETTDPRVGVVCFVRTDSKPPWWSDPASTPGFWRFDGKIDPETGHKIAAAGSRIEVRFACSYKPGVLDLAAFSQHGWKTTISVKDVRVEYEGQTRIFDEQVTAR